MKHLKKFESFSTLKVDLSDNTEIDEFKYVYEENFMDDDDFYLLREYTSKYEKYLLDSKDSRDGVVRYNLPIDSKILTQMLKKYESKIRELTDNNLIYLSDYPIELRKYVKGCFMSPHKDTQIYKIPQYECVFTISNTTDSVTNVDGDEIRTIPNSLLILKACGATHHVTEVSSGERNFLKFIFTETDELLED